MAEGDTARAHRARRGFERAWLDAVYDAEATAWMEDAVCAQTDPEEFYPDKGGTTRHAKAVCSGCDVRAECLQYALDNDEGFGIWGGLSAMERRKIKRRGRLLNVAPGSGAA